MPQISKSTVAKAFYWSFIEQIFGHGIQFFIAIILARLLTPADFGLVGMIAVIFSLCELLIESGFVVALIQKKDADRCDFNTVFIFSVAFSIVAYSLIYSMADWVSAFYRTPELTAILRILGLKVIFISLGVAPVAWLRRELKFKALAIIGFSSVGVSGLMGIFLAYKNFGVWALVFQQLLSVIISIGGYWIVAGWKPNLLFRWQRFVQLYSFGIKILASGLLGVVQKNVFHVVLGRYFSASALGYYTRAESFQQMPERSLLVVFARTSFPIMSRLQENITRMREATERMARVMMFVNIPLMVGLAVVADPLIRVLLTDRWAPSVPYLRALCLCVLFQPMSSLNYNIYKALGQPGLQLLVELGKTIALFVIIVFLLPYGILAMIYAKAVLNVLFFLIESHVAGWISAFGVKRQLRVCLPPLLLAGVMAAATHAAGSFLLTPGMQLTAQAAVGILVYLGGALLFRFRAVRELAQGL